jgi:hypothetical protein
VLDPVAYEVVRQLYSGYISSAQRLRNGNAPNGIAATRKVWVPWFSTRESRVSYKSREQSRDWLVKYHFVLCREIRTRRPQTSAKQRHQLIGCACKVSITQCWVRRYTIDLWQRSFRSACLSDIKMVHRIHSRLLSLY